MKKLLLATLLVAIGLQTQAQNTDALQDQYYEYYNNGDFNNAIKYALKVLDIQEKSIGKNHPDYAFTLGNLGVYYLFASKYEKALAINLEVVELRKRILGVEDEEYHLALGNLASTYSKLGRYSTALSINLELLEIRERIIGKKHLDYIQTSQNIASNYSKLGKYEKALEAYLEVIKMYNDISNTETQGYAMAINNLASTYYKLGNFHKSLEYRTQGLSLFENLVPKGHPVLLKVIKELGNNFAALDDEFIAIDTIKYVLKKIESNLGKENEYYALGLQSLTICYYNIKNYSRALNLCNEALSIQQKLLGKINPDYANTLFILSQIYFATGDNRGMQTLLEVIDIQERTLPKDHPYYLKTLGYYQIIKNLE